MPAEVTVLALAALLQVLQIVLMAVPANAELGPRTFSGGTLPYRMGAIEVPERRGFGDIILTGPAAGAMTQYFVVLAIVVVVTLGNAASPLTAGCAWLYLAARVLYVPAYAFGWSPWRSIFWTIGLAATCVMIVVALL